MTHEPECDGLPIVCQECSHDILTCACSIASTAYQRGREDAARQVAAAPDELPHWDGDSYEVYKQWVKEVMSDCVEEFQSKLWNVLFDKLEEFDQEVRQDEARRQAGYQLDGEQA